jgi:hypothetical protein
MNFALALATGRFVNRRADAMESWQSGVESALAGDLSDTTRATIAKATGDIQPIALVLGSPEFQKR